MPPLQLTVVAPVPAPTLPSAKSHARRGRSRIAKVAIGRKALPILVAAVQEIEQDRRRHDRHPRRADGEAAAFVPQKRLHAGGRIETERRTAGQGNGVDTFHGLRRIEQSRVAGSRTAAAHVDRSGGRFVKNDCGRAGTEREVFGVADFDSRNVGEEIAQCVLLSFQRA